MTRARVIDRACAWVGVIPKGSHICVPAIRNNVDTRARNMIAHARDNRGIRVYTIRGYESYKHEHPRLSLSFPTCVFIQHYMRVYTRRRTFPLRFAPARRDARGCECTRASHARSRTGAYVRICERRALARICMCAYALMCAYAHVYTCALVRTCARARARNARALSIKSQSHKGALIRR